MKILLIFYSLLSFFGSDLNRDEINIKSSYQELEEITYNYGKYIIIEKKNVVEILYNESRIELLNKMYWYKIINNEELLTVFYKKEKNDYIYTIKFNKGKVSKNTEKIINNKFINEFDVVYCNNSYILVTTVQDYENEEIVRMMEAKNYLSQQNAIILQFTDDLKFKKCEIYGGKLNDSFKRIYLNYSNETIFITGEKDQNTSYDFGNGGNGSKGYIFCEIDDDLEIVKYLIFDYRIINVEFGENIKIFTTHDCFLLNDNLTVISSLAFDTESVFSMGVNINWVVSFGIREAKFYDLTRGLSLYTYEYEKINELEEVVVIEDYLVLKGRNSIYKGVFYNDVFSDKQFIYDNLELSKLNTEVVGVPQNFKLENISYEENYDPMIFGEYDIEFNYKYFSIKSKLKVLNRCNITNNNIYPVGYNIFFSGTAFLNDEEVYNNYEVMNPGEYKLKLVGKDEEVIINFKVYDMDISFHDEHLKNWDYEVLKYQDLKMEFTYNEDIIIEDIIVNNQSYIFYDDVEKNKIIITFNHSIEGEYQYLLNYIVYRKNNSICTKEINYLFKINVLQDKMLFENDFYNDDDNFIFKTKFDNSNNQLRFIKIVTDIDYYLIPIKKGEIKFPENINGDLKFYLVYDVKGKLYEEQVLFEMTYENTKNNIFGILELKINNNVLNEITITVPINEKVRKIIVDERICYQYQNNNQYTVIIYCVIIISVLFIVAKVFKNLKLKKNK